MSDLLELDLLSELHAEFPILQQEFNGKPFVYLDSAATTQKPQKVIDAISHYYAFSNANVHRGIYALSERSTAQHEASRQTIKQFINAKHNHEIVFTRGTTEAINLVADCFAQSQLKPGDEVLISGVEHHSNIVPWQIACEKTGALLKVIPIDMQGNIILEEYKKLLSDKTKIVSVTHVSNVLGTINPVKEIVDLAHANNTPVLLDGAQAVPHLSVDVQALDCDFYAFSSHKLYGPTGIGVLYGKEAWLEKLPPYQSGGDMISRVSFAKTEYNVLPHKFEAGTPNMVGVVGLAAAIDFVNNIGMDNIVEYDEQLLQYATEQMQEFPGLRIIGDVPNKTAVISFTIEGVHPHDIATILDHDAIAIRAGHHCAMPLMEHFHVPATARVSFGLYNRKQDIDCLMQGLQKITALLG